MELNSFELAFLYQMQPRLLKEVECLFDLDTIQYPGRQEKFMQYKRSFLLNSFSYMAGKMFFLSHDVHDAGIDNLFIDFCKRFQQIHSLK